MNRPYLPRNDPRFTWPDRGRVRRVSAPRSTGRWWTNSEAEVEASATA
jgi:hypothetical protein